jgi:hypothetical protein
MAKLSIEHPVVGTLRHEQEHDWWAGRFELSPGQEIDFSFSAWNGADPKLEDAELIRRGVDFLTWARATESRVRERIADELLATYNDTWASEGEGGFGPLSRSEFLQQIAPESIVVHIRGDSYWYYDDGGLFANHIIEVRISQERDINEVGLAG